MDGGKNPARQAPSQQHGVSAALKQKSKIAFTDPGHPFWSTDTTGTFFDPRKLYLVFFQAGLLTFGSFYRLNLPSLTASSIFQLSSPITAAGRSLTHTGFPVRLFTSTWKWCDSI